MKTTKLFIAAIAAPALIALPATAGDSDSSSSYSGGGKSPSDKSPIITPQPQPKKGGGFDGSAFTLTPFYGAAFCASGNMLEGGWAKPGGTDVDINPTDCDDAHEMGLGGGLELGYALNPTTSLLLGVGKYSADGETTTVGTFGASDALTGSFDDLDWTSVYAGIKKDTGIGFAGLNSHTKLLAGVKMVDDVSATFTAPGYDSGSVGVYDDSNVFEAQALIGVSYPVSDNIAVGVEGGVAFATALDGDDSDLGAIGDSSMNLGSANDTDEFWSFPVRVFVDVNF